MENMPSDSRAADEGGDAEDLAEVGDSPEMEGECH